ncbi:long-chain fatty acid CoA ligase, putative [Theileria equi strain WA]|uniref:Long-chain fatty acid CoA ligase, putative n=1 Tax=Theileria equi strain WA TaxID=1537102 RepID=L0AY64_THEEQ|nr:long-chain fatty acid CoA ligase, putative [Theileria equi strain WA]AFZ80500.1 long-chain fatty acid CoA ligase, putative [Theileria equi strain WA]|eukprot:XP_004830166.1 long-chain fatty acid CoA ligase, putative [Theileria equi strain WA]
MSTSNTYFVQADSPGFYSVPIPGSEEDGYSPIYKNTNYDTITGASDLEDVGDIKTSRDLFLKGLKMNPDAPCLGSRKNLPDGSLGEYEFRTYKEVEHLSKVVGSSIIQMNLTKEHSSGKPDIPPCRFVGLFVPSCEEWILCEQGSYAYGLTLVPIYHTMGPNSILFILKNTQLELLVCTVETAEIVVSVLESETEEIFLSTIVLIRTGDIPDGLLQNKFKIRFILWSSLLSLDHNKILPVTPAPLNALNLISYTSGTTGLPKGVMITHKNFIDTVVTALHMVYHGGLTGEYFNCHLSYLPMAHLFEKTFLNAVFYYGGKVGLYSGDVKKVLDDIQTLKPTLFISVPRLFQRIHDKIISGISEKPFPIRFLFYRGLNYKIRKIRRSGVYTSYIYDKIIFDKVKKLLGGNIRWMFVGSSTMSPIIVDRIKALFGVPLLWGYSLTESTAGSFVQHIGDTDSSNCGGPLPSIHFRLRSVPELSYFVNEKPPRGELLLKGNGVTPGYFKMDDVTKDVIKDSWLHTGDVVELLENGSIRVIDRIKHLFKLSQGEYVAPEYVESIINSTPHIAQSFVCGRSDQAFPVAIVVPDEEALKSWIHANFKDMTFDRICKTKELYDLIFEEIASAFTENNLKGFEKVKAVYLEHTLFSLENDLLTVTSKLRRSNLQKKYKEEIDKMYRTINLAKKQTEQ